MLEYRSLEGSIGLDGYLGVGVVGYRSVEGSIGLGGDLVVGGEGWLNIGL